MKQLFLYFLLLFIINFVDSVDGIPRYWSFENDGKTYIAMNMLNENINLTFPKETTFSRIAFDFRIYSPTQNQGCPDADNFRFKLFIGHENYVRGAVLSDAYYHLYEKCGDAESQYPIMAGRNNGLLGLRCFKNGNPFLLSDKDSSKSVMELQISGSFPCQIYMILPSYMGIEDKDDDVVASKMEFQNLESADKD
uniref:Uncharacterized protein n=1 Tax=Panagrolaimus sp. ES5 TaxID=591445 RepID=A0AC34G0J3_9BILA